MLGTTYPGQAYLGQAAPARIYWGVHSVTAANADTLSPDPNKKFFDILADRAGSPPAFWGRYIGHPNPDFNLKPDTGEVQYLGQKNCRISLFWAGETATSVSKTGLEGRLNGESAANGAIAAARSLGVPGGKKVWIYCDIEFDWSPTVAFFTGWFDTMNAYEYVGGVYGGGNVDDQSNFDQPYCDAYGVLLSMRTGPALLWSDRPRSQFPPCDMRQDFRDLAPAFDPRRPPCKPPTVAHHYAGNCGPVPDAKPGQLIDLDLANEFGFERMWAPAPKWEAFVVDHAPVFSVETIALSNIVRSMESMPDGRLYITVMGNRGDLPDYAGMWLRSSEDGGETWQVRPSTPTDVSTGVELSGSLLQRGTNLDFFWHRSSLGPTIFRSTFDGASWASRVAFHAGSAGDAGGPRAARSRDRTVRSLIWAPGSGSFAGHIRYAPINADGTAGTVESAATSHDGFSGNDLFYDNQNRPVVVQFNAAIGKWRRKVRDPSTGWPTNWEEFDLTDPITNPEEFRTAAWAWGAFAASGDAHGLLKPAVGTSFVHTHRRRASGAWSQGSVDFATLDSPVTGSDAQRWRETILMPIVESSPAGVFAALLADANSQSGSTNTFSVWCLRRR